MGIKFANNVSTALANSIAIGQTTFDVQNSFGFPVLAAGDYFYGTIADNVGNVEIVKVTSVVGNTLTALRGQDSTPDLLWASGVPFEIRVTAQDLRTVSGAEQGFFQHTNTITSDQVIDDGNNAISGGPMTIAPGATVTVPAGSTWTIA